MLFTLQRYEFFSKSQRCLAASKHFSGCCLPYKGTNFSANHNYHPGNKVDYLDVVYPTKVRIFQQITTGKSFSYEQKQMLFTLQRYEFFSKSQRSDMRVWASNWCCLPYKGTNFSANHNYITILRIDVVYPTKVRIFQQITTRCKRTWNSLRMLFTLQRYEFFSKSQRGWQHFILSPVISKFKPNNFS